MIQNDSSPTVKQDSAREFTLPRALGSEAAVLGVLIFAPQTLSAVRQTGLRAEDFSTSVHQRIFGALVEMDAKSIPIDAVSLADFMMAGGDEAAGIAVVVADLLVGPVVAESHVRHHAGVVLRTSQRRALIALAESLAEKASDAGSDPGAVADAFAAKLQHRRIVPENFKAQGATA